MALFHQFMKVWDMLSLCMLGNGACTFVATADFFYFIFLSKEEGKYQESIQSSTIPDLGWGGGG